jgi:hypothetical protein
MLCLPSAALEELGADCIRIYTDGVGQLSDPLEGHVI